MKQTFSSKNSPQKQQGVCVCVCVCVNGPVNSQVYMEMQRVKNSKNNLKEKQHWKTWLPDKGQKLRL